MNRFLCLLALWQLPHLVLAAEFSCPNGHRLDVIRSRRRRSRASRFSCTECPPGQYMNLHDHTQTNCYQCQAPQWQDLPGASSCKASPNRPVLCPAGKWGLVAATIPDTPCHLCPMGKYQSNQGQGSCHQCPSGRFQPSQGAEQCQPALATQSVCPAGKYGALGTTDQTQATCTPCPVDTFQSHPGQGWCGICPGGQHQPTPGQTVCQLIPKCPRYQYWNQAQRSCANRHPYLKYLVAPAWTMWVLTILQVCLGDPMLQEPDHPLCLMIFYNFVVCLAIGIESTRLGGYLNDTRFWVMTGFLGVSALSWLWRVSLVGIWWIRASCQTCPETVHQAQKQAAVKVTERQLAEV